MFAQPRLDLSLVKPDRPADPKARDPPLKCKPIQGRPGNPQGLSDFADRE